MGKYDVINQPMGSDDVVLKDYTAEEYKPQSSPYINSIYTESPSITQAKLNLQNQLNSNQGQYQNGYADKIMSLIDRLGNNSQSSINAQGIRQEFQNNLGKSAQDTLMNIAMLSGGYGNTYASAVADQQKQAGLLNINDINPSLAQVAQSIKQGEQDNIYSLLNAYNTQDDIAYGRYRDTAADNQSELQRLTDLYLSQIQSDRADFEADRNFNQSAFEFTESQKQNAFENYQNRLQAQTQQDNDNTLSAWDRTWDNYWKAQDVNEANKQNAFDEDYNDYQLSERAKSIAEANARAQIQAKSKQTKAEEDANEKINVQNYKNDVGVNKFLSTVMTKAEFDRRTKNASQGAYNGFDTYEDYIDNALDTFNFSTTNYEDSKKYKLSDGQKAYLMSRLGVV